MCWDYRAEITFGLSLVQRQETKTGILFWYPLWNSCGEDEGQTTNPKIHLLLHIYAKITLHILISTSICPKMSNTSSPFNQNCKRIISTLLYLIWKMIVYNQIWNLRQDIQATRLHWRWRFNTISDSDFNLCKFNQTKQFDVSLSEVQGMFSYWITGVVICLQF